ncbi:MarR family winged helix-turn-helix transcriptional regulator [Tautonia rosea]|uniref:MarR family winged helix-turn-helix transcriptional regulator n=1 Tax=Tautonia rosea TaxID=2728037 RepID=UPI0014727901|nr:MarR family transcriptional regulator [Tautonia rosea]
MNDRTEELGTTEERLALDPRQTSARERYGFLLAMAAHRLRSRFEEELEPMGVQLKHVQVLAMIYHFGPVAQQRLGESICIDRTSMVGLLDEMERRDLVQRQPDPVDRRAHRIHLTESGQDLFRRANDTVEGVENEVLAPLSEQERLQLKSMLQRIIDPGAWSGFEHINIKVSGRAGEATGRSEALPSGSEGRSR